MTTPKRLVAEFLARQRSHRTADEIRAGVQRREPSVSTSTIYRILEEFDELGVVSHSHAGGNAAVYHLADVEHAHLHCEDCGKIFEVPSSHLDDLAKQLRGAYGFNLDRHHVALSGRCDRCENIRRAKVKS